MSITNTTPGYTFSTSIPGELITPAKLNLLGSPTVSIPAGSITDTEISSVSGTKITAGTIPSAALDTNTQAKLSGLKNYSPNPDFGYWPLGTSITSGTKFAFNWNQSLPAITYSLSRTAATAGESDTVLGEAAFYLQFITSTTNASSGTLYVTVPNARLFSAKTINISFGAKLLTGTLPAISVFGTQYFGTGGSPSSNVVTSAAVTTPTNSWAIATASLSIPSVSGKTFGTSGDDAMYFGISFANFSSTFTLNIANFQVEQGNSNTAFENSLARKTGSDLDVDNNVCGGRLTLTTSTPILTANTSSATVYYTPFRGSRCMVYVNGKWEPRVFSTDLSVSVAALSVSDTGVFYIYDNNGQLALGYVLSGTLAYQDGVPVVSGDTSKRIVGGFICQTAGQLDMIFTCTAAGVSPANFCKCCVVNLANPVLQTFQTNVGTNWTYATNSWRPFNNDSMNSVTVGQLLIPTHVDVRSSVEVATGSGIGYNIGIGTATTALAVACMTGTISEGTGYANVAANLRALFTGSKSFYAIERSQAGTTATVNGNGNNEQCGITLSVSS